MRKSVTKIVKAVLGFAMALGAGVGAGVSEPKTSPIFAVANNDTFVRISSAGDLSDGDEIIFVNQAESYACGTTQNTNNRTPVAITVSSHTYTYNSSDNVQVFVVKKNNTKYGFHTGSGYIYSASSSKNYLKTNSTAASTAPSGTAAWTLEVSSNVFTVKNDSNTSYYLAFNGTDYFSQYSSNQIKPYIFKKSSGNVQSTSSVTYASGGAQTGTVPTDNTAYTSGSTVTVLGNTGNLDKNGYVFNGWSDGVNTYTQGNTFQITADVTLTAVWVEEVDAGASTYNLNQMSNFSDWGSSYTDHSHTFTVSGSETAVVTIKDSCKQTSTITDVPVSKGGDVTFVLNSDIRYIKNITFHAKQWGDKQQTMTLYTSNNGGVSYTSTNVSTNYFLIRGKNFSSGTNAVKIAFNSASNQVGYVDFAVLYDNLPDVEATSMTFAPASLSLFGDEAGSFTPSLVGGSGNYEKTIAWTSSHPSIIAAPSNSEAGEEINVTPERVASNTDVTLTGTVQIAGGASASIVITVKVIKEIAVSSVDVSGIENNAALNGASDNSIAANKKIQFSANVNYVQGNIYMDGDNTVTWSSNNDGVATVNSTGLVTLKGNGSVTITATSVENTNKSAALTFTVSNINEQLGTVNNPYSVAQARAAIDANEGITNVYVKGYISQIDSYNSTYHSITYWVSDDGTNLNALEVYSGKDIDGADFSSIDDVELGASVVVNGTLKLFNEIYEFDKNNELVSYEDPNAEHKIIGVLNSSSSIALINGEETWSSGVKPEKIVFANLGLVNGTQYSDPFDGGNFTITFGGGGNDGKYYDSGTGIRTYASGTITIASSITFTKVILKWDGSNKPSTNGVVSAGTYNKDTGVWTGSSKSITFTRPSGSGNWSLQSVQVVYGELTGVDAVKLRLGASIPVETWNAVNAMDGVSITDYGVMIFRTDESHISSAPSVEAAYKANPANVAISRKNSNVPPAAENGAYSFVTKINITSTSNYDMYFCARAFIVVNGTEYYFVGDEMQETVRTVAQDNNGSDLSADALAYLAGN